MKIKTFDNRFLEITCSEIEGDLVALPALIDPHVHLRTPGSEYKEDWQTGAAAAISGGFGTVLDMPNNNPPAIDAASLEHKKKIIDEQLKTSGLPLRYGLYFGATPDNFTELEKVKDKIVAVKIFMAAPHEDRKSVV